MSLPCRAEPIIMLAFLPIDVCLGMSPPSVSYVLLSISLCSSLFFTQSLPYRGGIRLGPELYRCLDSFGTLFVYLCWGWLIPLRVTPRGGRFERQHYHRSLDHHWTSLTTMGRPRTGATPIRHESGKPICIWPYPAVQQTASCIEQTYSRVEGLFA